MIKRILAWATFFAAIITVAVMVSACSATTDMTGGSAIDANNTINAANKLQEKQPTPTDFEYSMARYLLMKRAYWINGERTKAVTLPNPVPDMPLGYIVLLSGGVVVSQFTVDGMVISLNSYLTPDAEWVEQPYNSEAAGLDAVGNQYIADIDGTYGENEDGVFFFTADGDYHQWKGDYLYGDKPFDIGEPMLKVGATE